MELVLRLKANLKVLPPIDGQTERPQLPFERSIQTLKWHSRQSWINFYKIFFKFSPGDLFIKCIKLLSWKCDSKVRNKSEAAMRPEDTNKNIFWPIRWISEVVNNGTITLTPATTYPISTKLTPPEAVLAMLDWDSSWPSWKLDLNRNVMFNNPVREVNVMIVTAVIKGCKTDLEKLQ